MADDRHESDIDDNDELLLTDEVDQDDETQSDDDEEQQNDDDHDEEEETLTFGDDAEEQDGDSKLVGHLRNELKRRGERIAELEKTTPRDEPVEVGPKPTMADCGYDEEEFEKKLDEWHERRRKAEARQSLSEEAQQKEHEAWKQELGRVERQKADLPYADADDAFDTVRAALNTVQQAVIVKASDNAARVIYALSKNPERLAELAAVEDPLKLAATVARLEGQLKVVKRRRAPEPEKVEKGSGRISKTSSDKTLADLEKKAEKTGDRTALIAYRREQRQKESGKK